MAALQIIMADVGKLIPIAKNVFELSQSQVVKDVKDWESNLKNLNKTVSYINNMLLDMDSKSELSHEERGWVEELVEVLYEADDLLDEVITTAKMKELNKGDDSNEFFKRAVDEVSRFFSCMNCILVKYNTSQEVKTIQLKLDAIARDHQRYKLNAGPQPSRYEFMVDHHATLERRADTSSVLDENIIGREDDMKVIVDMLIDPNVEENVGFVAIVGIGGLGKTTLAQLVYNHNKVGTMFDEKFWVCVSDQHGKGLNVKAILDNIIELSRNKKPSEVSTMQSMQINLQKEIKNKTYLLILDDVWTEDPNEWNELRKYLSIGGKGSRVVITTRSEKTAQVVLGKATHSKKYMLQGLSLHDSWRLFLVTAFELEPDKAKDPELIKIGKKIVKKCSNVPLAIKVLGRLLNGQTHKWELFEKSRLPQIETTKNPIIPILKLSYDNLEPSVKNCFRYCALFPKGFEMEKRNLIGLWYAQGYSGDNDDYFFILLNRCLWYAQGYSGDIISVKMHDLMHDLAQEVAGDEIIVGNSLPSILSRKNRHLFIDGRDSTENSFHERNIRHTCDMNTTIHDLVKTLVVDWPWLRSLCLYGLDFENLSESIGELLHLRYLDLSRNKKLKTLPNSISKLYNLQCLVMRDCHGFNEWPKDFCKLVNLRLLDIHLSHELACMPLGIDQLINLRDLTDFKVGGASSIEEQCGAQLKDLKSLVNLRGEIVVTIYGTLASENENENENEYEDGYLKHIENLEVVTIWIPPKTHVSDQKALIGMLQPSQYLLKLHLSGYNVTEIPRWGRANDDWAIILPNLVKVRLHSCESLDCIPLLSKLKHLKFLSLFHLDNLEYMETGAISHYSSGSEDIQFFPSLEYLNIEYLERLKGWRRGVGESSSSSKSHWLPPFPCLLTLIIHWCPLLTSFPPCPSLKSLEVWRSKNLLGTSPGEGHGNLDVRNCSSLQSLDIRGCTRLTSVLGALEHLTALESLSLGNADGEVDFSYMHWSFLSQKLRSLELSSFRTLRTLPTEMQHLTALENLTIGYCYKMEGLPEWISCLSSLHSLTIQCCPDFKSLGTIQNITSLQKLVIKNSGEFRDYEEPSGKEWHKIRHIPHFSFIR